MRRQMHCQRRLCGLICCRRTRVKLQTSNFRCVSFCIRMLFGVSKLSERFAICVELYILLWSLNLDLYKLRLVLVHSGLSSYTFRDLKI